VQPLQLPATDLTPAIHFDKEKEIFLIEGRSVADNPEPTFEQALNWLQEYSKSPNSTTKFCLKFEYYNPATARLLLNLFKVLESMKGAKIIWQFLEDDEDMEESGQELAELVTIPFDFQPY
jgi:hypothetical protein